MADEPGDRPDSHEESRRLTKGEIRWIIGGVIAVLFGVFIAQNADETKIDFIFFSANVRLIWLFLICAVIGAVIDRLLQRRGLLPTTRRKRKEEGRRTKDQ
jgi:uncharacterized integral membrane protein